MIFATVACLGGLGMACILFHRNFLGLLIGSQMALAGAALFLVALGQRLGVRPQEGALFAFFVLAVSVVHTIGGLAIATRLFFLRKRIELEGISCLKH